MTRNKGIWFSSIMVLLTICLALGGCGKKQNQSAEKLGAAGVYPENGLPKDKIDLGFIFPVQGLGKDYFQHAVDTFQEKFPNVNINVRYIESGAVEYGTIIQSLVQSGDDKEMPDWIYGLAGEAREISLINGKRMEPQDELWERAFYDKPDLLVKDGTLGERDKLFSYGHMYALSHSASISGVYFNQDFFKKHALNMSPKNWNEYLDLCAKIKALNVNPLVMAGKFAYAYFKGSWGAIPYIAGGEQFLKDEYNYADNLYLQPAFVESMEKLDQFARLGYLHPGTISFDHTQSQMELIQGKAAMVTVGAWVANEMKEVTPKDFKWGFMPFPANNSPEQSQVITTTSYFNGWIWKNRPEINKQWAKEFNLWLLNLDVQKKLAYYGGVPFRKDFAEDPKNLEGISPSVAVAMEVIRDPKIKVVNAGIRDPKKRNLVKNEAEMAKVQKILGDSYIALISGKITPKQAAQKVNSHYMRGLGK